MDSHVSPQHHRVIGPPRCSGLTLAAAGHGRSAAAVGAVGRAAGAGRGECRARTRPRSTQGGERTKKSQENSSQDPTGIWQGQGWDCEARPRATGTRAPAWKKAEHGGQGVRQSCCAACRSRPAQGRGARHAPAKGPLHLCLVLAPFFSTYPRALPRRRPFAALLRLCPSGSRTPYLPCLGSDARRSARGSATAMVEVDVERAKARLLQLHKVRASSPPRSLFLCYSRARNVSALRLAASVAERREGGALQRASEREKRERRR